MPEMQDLIARLENASEGSRELDDNIWSFDMNWEDLGGWGVRHKVTGEIRDNKADNAPHYTASLDAALSLVGDRWYRLEAMCDGLFVARVAAWNVHTDDAAEAVAATAALALTSAALKARQVKAPSDAG